MIRTIAELNAARKSDPEMVQHYLRQVSVVEDLSSYLKWLDDSEATTTVVSKLKRYKQRSKGIHPSSASKKNVCLLKLYYECTEEVEPRGSYDEKMQLTWDVGSMLHDMYQTWFEDMYGEQFKKEVPLKSDDGYVQSRTDGVFTFPDYRFVIEMKSIKEGGNYGWDTIQSKPMLDHINQAHFYMWLADAPFALIFYMNKNAGEYREHAIAFDQTLWDWIMDKVIVPVVEAAYLGGDKELVPANPQWSCRWCSFSHGCPEKGGKNEDVDW